MGEVASALRGRELAALWGPHQPPGLCGAAEQAPGPPHQANLHTAWGTWRPMTLTRPTRF